MSCFSIAAAMDSQAPWLMNLGTHLHSNPIKLLNKWIIGIQTHITEEFDRVQTDGLLVTCLFYDFWQMV